MSPLCIQRWGHIALPLSAQSVSVCVCLSFISLQRFLSCRRSNTKRWPNVGLRRWSNMFGASLNVGRRHRRRANIKLWFKSWSTGDAGPTLNRHWIGVSLDIPPPTERTVQCWIVDGQSQRRWTSVEPELGWRVTFAAVRLYYISEYVSLFAAVRLYYIISLWRSLVRLVVFMLRMRTLVMMGLLWLMMLLLGARRLTTASYRTTRWNWYCLKCKLMFSELHV